MVNEATGSFPRVRRCVRDALAVMRYLVESIRCQRASTIPFHPNRVVSACTPLPFIRLALEATTHKSARPSSTNSKAAASRRNTAPN